MSWYYLVQKDEHFVIATSGNVKEFEEIYGFHKVFGFSGQRYHVEFYTIKALWYDEVLHRTRKDAKLWRIAMDIEKLFAKKLATHMELLKRQAAERKKKRIFPKEGMEIQNKDIKWLACEKCKRIYYYTSHSTEPNHEYTVKEDKKVWAVDLCCGSGRGCNDAEGKHWVLTRLKTSGKRNARKSTLLYTVKYGKYTLYWN